MDYFLKMLSDTLYTMPLMVLLQLVAAVISIIKRKKFVELRYFHFYPLSGILQSMISITSFIYLERIQANRIAELSINIFALTEVLLIYQLMFKVIKIKKMRHVLKVSLTGFLIYIIATWFFNDAFYTTSSRILAIEGIVILIPISLYFFQLFRLSPTLNLFDQPTFWINVGILFVFSCTLPISILEYFIEKFVYANFYFYYIVFISYSVLYLFVIRAYLCKARRNGTEIFELLPTNLSSKEAPLKLI